VEPLPEIEALVAHEGRAPGSDAERRAAKHLEARLRDMGRDAAVEPIEVRPSFTLTHILHALAAIAGSVLSVSSPLPATALLLVTAASAFGDLTGRFRLARRVTPRRASQNVVSREDGARPGTLVLVAHYDAGRAGAAFGWRFADRAFQAFSWSILVALACSALRLAGVDATPLTVVQFAAAVALIVSVPALADVGLSGVVPGANDNASGVATVLRLAERYGGDLDYFDVWVVLTGAEEGMELGMRAWLRANRRRLDRARTAFLCVDQVGYGTVRYAGREGYVAPNAQNATLIELCDQIADEDREQGRYGARTYTARNATDAYAARTARFPAVSVSCLGARDVAPHHHRESDTLENVDPVALDRAFRFCSELIELIDERIGPDLETTEPIEES
jgi:Iap family predicted aminopeptidase